jgi:uncharacterized DUF497 family protein
MKVHEPAIGHEGDLKGEKRILCIGKIHKGRKTMIIAFPQKGENEHVSVSQSREEEGKA